MDKITIGFIGKVSGGKSSVINSICGAFVSPVSLKRETLNILEYVLNTGSFDFHKEIITQIIQKNIEITDSNKSKIPKIHQLSTVTNPIPSNFKNIDLIDFPGLDDSNDCNKIFFSAFENNFLRCDIIVFVTEAPAAFRDDSEYELFKRIQVLLKRQNDKFIDLVVLVNKYDDIGDEEFAEIFKEMEQKIKPVKPYRYSAHIKLIDFANYAELYVPQIDKFQREYKKILSTHQKNLGTNGDHDGFFQMIDNSHNRLYELNKQMIFNHTKKNIECIHYIYSKTPITERSYVYENNPQLDCLISKYQLFSYNWKYKDFYADIFSDYLNTPTILKCKLVVRFYDLLTMDFIEYDKIINPILERISDNINNISTITLSEIFYRICDNGLFNKYETHCRRLFNYLIINREIHRILPSDYQYLYRNGTIIKYTNAREINFADASETNFIGIIKKCYVGNNWFTVNLSSAEFIPKDIQYLLRLSVFDYEIKRLVLNDQIYYDILRDHYPYAKSYVTQCITNGKHISIETFMGAPGKESSLVWRIPYDIFFTLAGFFREKK